MEIFSVLHSFVLVYSIKFYSTSFYSILFYSILAHTAKDDCTHLSINSFSILPSLPSPSLILFRAPFLHRSILSLLLSSHYLTPHSLQYPHTPPSSHSFPPYPPFPPSSSISTPSLHLHSLPPFPFLPSIPPTPSTTTTNTTVATTTELSRVKRLLATAQAGGASEDPVLHLMMAQTCLGLGKSHSHTLRLCTCYDACTYVSDCAYSYAFFMTVPMTVPVPVPMFVLSVYHVFMFSL